MFFVFKAAYEAANITSRTYLYHYTFAYTYIWEWGGRIKQA